ncbi:hypothetical protein BDV38DRAFT_287733 [Aspergillus pseudotamarii]|uniref:Polyketide synthase dehydratase domain-containing protein n=1 Tax=Aspergillus pseudotamarii TaxID=132259 RepID=A0A5N6SCH7_ASPPS|nr:uncharacterized protein BDV38DRAFT_287733 [Aspergillus pseudotamarii]KAE8132416.1 hypothetical protein BDV38DRAFT_287733 [Aspergillus pseudotamarii]
MVEGPAFWCVKEGFYDDQYRVRATIGLFRWPEDGFPQPHVIHPTSLDSIFHLALIGYCHSGKRTVPTMIPSSLRRLYVSRTGLSYPDSDEVQEYTWPEILDRRGACFSGFALNQSNGALSVQFSDLRLTTIASSRDDSVADTLGGLQLAYQIQYQPEPDFLDPKERYMDMLAHRNGDLRILELNVGDRSSTKALLHTLSVYNEAGGIVYPRLTNFSTEGVTLQTGWRPSPEPQPIDLTKLETDSHPDWISYHCAFYPDGFRRGHSYAKAFIPRIPRHEATFVEQWIEPD